MFASFRNLLVLSSFLLGGCSVEGPITPPSGDTSSSSSSGDGTSSSSTGSPATCAAASECSAITQKNECMYADCALGECKAFPQPQGTPCEVGDFPNKTCNGLGACGFNPAATGCITATGDGDPANGCDDGNPCTQDYQQDGACHHNFKGLGSVCGQNGQTDGVCTSGGVGEQCCPVFPATSLNVCGEEGVQDVCAEGSVCLGAVCWIACAPTDSGSCSSTPWPTCAPKTVGTTTVYICQ